jgi:hypothetical protein
MKPRSAHATLHRKCTRPTHGGDEHHPSPVVKNCLSLSLLLFLSFLEGKGGAAVSSAEQRRATQKSD